MVPPCGDKALHKPQRFLTDEEWEKEMERYESYKDRIFTDGSVLQTFECSDPALARAMRSGKHSIPAYVFFVVVSPRGRIVYVSDYVVGGSVHDSVHWQVSDVVKWFKEPYPTAFTATGKRRAVFGDKAYPCINTPDDWQLIITKTGETDVPEFEVDDAQNEEMAAMVKVLQERYALRDATGAEIPGVSFDPEIAVPRSVVERTIRRIKSTTASFLCILDKLHHRSSKYICLVVYKSIIFSLYFENTSHKPWYLVLVCILGSIQFESIFSLFTLPDNIIGIFMLFNHQTIISTVIST